MNRIIILILLFVSLIETGLLSASEEGILKYRDGKIVDCKLLSYDDLIGIDFRETGSVFIFYTDLIDSIGPNSNSKLVGEELVDFNDIKSITIGDIISRIGVKVVVKYKSGLKRYGYAYKCVNFTCFDINKNMIFKVKPEKLRQIVFRTILKIRLECKCNRTESQRLDRNGNKMILECLKELYIIRRTMDVLNDN